MNIPPKTLVKSRIEKKYDDAKKQALKYTDKFYEWIEKHKTVKEWSGLIVYKYMDKEYTIFNLRVEEGVFALKPLEKDEKPVVVDFRKENGIIKPE